MPTKDRTWFERKVRELADALRGVSPARRRDVVEALEKDREPGARQGTDRLPDKAKGESGSR
jgi:hypothetical protein